MSKTDMDGLREKLHDLMMDFVGAYESFDEIPEARQQAEDKILALIASERQAAAIEVLESLKQEMKMHTVPESPRLITRSYLNNSIDFKIEELRNK